MRRLEFVSLQVLDLEASKKFYTEKLGFEIMETGNPAAVVFTYKKGDASFAIRNPIGNIEGKNLGLGVSIWFTIDGTIEDLKTEFAKKNVSVVGEVTNTPFGKTIMVKDPNGYTITFLEGK